VLPPTRAYATLNLLWNPFSEPNQEERAALAVQMPNFLLEPKKAILFLGEKGRGKTTHLLALQQKNPNAPYIHLPEFGKHPSIPRARIIFLDEAQRLPRLTRQFIWQRAKTWVIASHENHTYELEQAGFSVQVVSLTGLTLEKLEAIIKQRLEWARRSNGEIPRVSKEKLRQLLTEYGDNLRGIEGALYDEYQQMQRSKP
jgi:energy-coupling factor transporter ATP-binding protein EcfA2